jgi:hypothetical protein
MNQALKIIVVLLAFVGIFLAGAVTGGVVTALVSKNRFQQFQFERQQEQHEHQMEQTKRQMEQQHLTGLVNALRQQLLQQQQQQLQQQQRQQQMPRGPGGLPTPEQFGPRLMQRFVNQIKPSPTPEQRDQIRPLVNQAAEELRRLRQETAHSTELTLEHLEDQISAILTPAQRDRFGDLIQKWRDDFEKYNAAQQQRQAQQRLREQQAQQRRQQQKDLQATPGPAGGAPAAPAAAPTPPPAAPAPAAPPAGGPAG